MTHLELLLGSEVLTPLPQLAVTSTSVGGDFLAVSHVGQPPFSSVPWT